MVLYSHVLFYNAGRKPNHLNPSISSHFSSQKACSLLLISKPQPGSTDTVRLITDEACMDLSNDATGVQ